MVVDIQCMPSGQWGKLSDLFGCVFGTDTNTDHWRWKYEVGPALSHANWVAIDQTNGSWLGHAGWVMFEGCHEGKPIRMAQVTDVMVHPEARSDLGSQNIYRQLMRKLLLDVPDHGPQHWPLAAYGFAGERPLRLGERMGFYRRVQPCQDVLVRYKPPHAWAFAPWSWRAQGYGDDLRNVPWSLLESFEAQVPTNSVHIKKTMAYLQWRYGAKAQATYTLWLLKRPWTGVGAWLVTRAEPKPTVVDFALGKKGPSWAQAIAALVRASGQSDWVAWHACGEAVKITTNGNNLAEVLVPGGLSFQQVASNFQPGDTDVY